MPVTRLGPFHHVGIAVREIVPAAEALERLFGAELESEVFHDLHQGVRVQFMALGGLRIELVEPASDPSPLKPFLTRGISIYHVCHAVDDLEDALERLKREGVKVVSPPRPAVAFGGRRVAFVLSQGLMIELLESEAV